MKQKLKQLVCSHEYKAPKGSIHLPEVCTKCHKERAHKRPSPYGNNIYFSIKRIK